MEIIRDYGSMNLPEMSLGRWLKQNDRALRGSPSDHIVHMAKLAGFPIQESCAATIERINLIRRLQAFWESPFAEKWMALVDYETGRD